MSVDSIGWIFPGFMLAAASPNRAALAMFIVKPDSVSAILAGAPFLVAVFRNPDVGTRTAPGRAAW
jgi:hypothetical protein